MQVRGGRITGMADSTEDLSSSDGLTSRNSDRTRREVSEAGEDVPAPGNDVVAEYERQPGWPEGQGVLEHERPLANWVDPASLCDSVDRTHDLAVKGRVNGH